MELIIDTSSMIPIYEQITDTVRKEIAEGRLPAGEALPSVRTLSRELKISALTVKKAYDQLERGGFTVTVHGKGTYVKEVGVQLVREERLKDLEHDLELLLEKARRNGVSTEELRELFDLMTEGM